MTGNHVELLFVSLKVMYIYLEVALCWEGVGRQWTPYPGPYPYQEAFPGGFCPNPAHSAWCYIGVMVDGAEVDGSVRKVGYGGSGDRVQGSSANERARDQLRY